MCIPIVQWPCTTDQGILTLSTALPRLGSTRYGRAVFRIAGTAENSSRSSGPTVHRQHRVRMMSRHLVTGDILGMLTDSAVPRRDALGC